MHLVSRAPSDLPKRQEARKTVGHWPYRLEPGSASADQDIWVYLCNLAPTDMIEYGHVLPVPGEETTWYDNLPKPRQDYIQKLGTTKENFRL